MKKIVDFKISSYFAWPIVFLGVIMLFIAISIVRTSYVGSAVLVCLSFIIFTTHYRLRVDFERNEYLDYLWILGFRSGTKRRFSNIDYIFIKESKVSQTMRVRVASSTIQKKVYDAYVRFDEMEKVHLLTKDDKESLIADLKEPAEMLGVRIVDYSAETQNHYGSK